MDQRLFFTLLFCVAILSIAALIIWFLSSGRMSFRSYKRKDVRPESTLLQNENNIKPEINHAEDPVITTLFKESPKTYIGLYRGILKTANGHHTAWQSCLKTWQKRVLNQHPELADHEIVRAAGQPESKEKAAAVAGSLLASILNAGIILVYTVPPQPGEYFMMMDGSEPVSGVPYSVESPAFVLDNNLLEAGMLLPGETAGS